MCSYYNLHSHQATQLLTLETHICTKLHIAAKIKLHLPFYYYTNMVATKSGVIGNGVQIDLRTYISFRFVYVVTASAHHLKWVTLCMWKC